MAQIIKFENDRATGLATPRYGAQRVAQNLDPDLFVRMLYNHPEHIERSKEKREQILEENRRKKLAEKMAEYRKERQMVFLGFCTIVSTLLAAVLASLLI